MLIIFKSYKTFVILRHVWIHITVLWWMYTVLLMPQTYELTFTIALLQKEIRIFFIFFIWAWIFVTILLKIFFCRAFVTGNWNTLLFVPFLFVEMTLKGSKQGVIAMHWRRSFSAPYYWAISYCHLGLRTRSRFRTLFLNNPKFYHCCISCSLPEVSFFLQMKYFGSHPLLLLLMILTKPKPPPRHWEAPRLTRRRCDNIRIEEVVGICSKMKTFKC